MIKTQYPRINSMTQLDHFFKIRVYPNEKQNPTMANLPSRDLMQMVHNYGRTS